MFISNKNYTDVTKKTHYKRIQNSYCYLRKTTVVKKVLLQYN